jgi:hypothetical protein
MLAAIMESMQVLKDAIMAIFMILLLMAAVVGLGAHLLGNIQRRAVEEMCLDRSLVDQRCDLIRESVE